MHQAYYPKYEKDKLLVPPNVDDLFPPTRSEKKQEKPKHTRLTDL